MLPERIQEVIAMARASIESQYPAEYEWILFGSWATGKARPNSDIDLAFRCTPEMPRHTYLIRRESMDDLETLYSIDLVDMNKVDTVLVQEITQEGMPLNKA